MSNVARNIQNSVYNTADVIVYPVFFFATVPFFMKHLGEEIFGLWMLMNTLILSFQVFNLGLGPAMMRYTALYHSTKNETALKNTVSTGIGISLLLFVLSIGVGSLIALLISKGSLFHLPASITPLAAKAMLLTSLIIGTKFCEQALLHVFKGLERFDIYFFINNTIRFITLGINMIQVYFLKSLTAMLAVSIVVTVMMLLVQLFVLKKIKKDIHPLPSLKKLYLLELMKFGFFTWIQSLIVLLVFQVDRFIVVSKYGTVTLGYYALTATIFVNIHTCITAAAYWLVPKITAQQNDQPVNTKLYKSLRAFVTITGIAALALFYICYKPLFTLWVGSEKLLQLDDFVPLFTAFEFFYILMIVPPLFLNYSGYVNQGTRAIYIVSLLNIAGLIGGFAYAGSINGMLWGLLLSTVAGVIIVYELINKLLFNKAFFSETLFFIAAAALGCTVIVFPSYIIQVGVLFLVLLLSWSYFVKIEKTDIRLLFN